MSDQQCAATHLHNGITIRCDEPAGHPGWHGGQHPLEYGHLVVWTPEP